MFKEEKPSDLKGQEVVNNLVMSIVKEQRAKRRWGIFFKLIVIGYIILMTLTIFVERRHPGLNQPHVAEIKVNGVIAPGTDNNADYVIEGLQHAFKNPNAKAVIVRINSPGGSPVQSEEIFNAMRSFEKANPNKKIYAVCQDACASGAYYIASAANEIYAQPSSLIGSIGVIMNGFGFSDAMKKLGIESRVLTAGKNKDFLDPFSPLKPGQKQFALKMLESVHQVFINDVKKGRGKRLKNSPDLFSGLIWTGVQAKQLGLIDGFATDRNLAIHLIKTPKIIDYTVKPDFFGRLSSQMGAMIHQTIGTLMASIHLS